MSELKDDLYQAVLESPLGATGVEKTLPELEELLKELRREDFWEDKKRKRRLSEEQMIRAWATYRQDLRALRERMRQRQQAWDDLLTWLAMFMIEHYASFARASAIYEEQFKLVFDMSWSMTPEQALACRSDWQAWAVEFLRDALRDPDLDDQAEPAAAGGQGGGSGDEDLTPTPHPKPAAPESSLEL